MILQHNFAFFSRVLFFPHESIIQDPGPEGSPRTGEHSRRSLTIVQILPTQIMNVVHYNFIINYIISKTYIHLHNSCNLHNFNNSIVFNINLNRSSPICMNYKVL